MRRRTIAIACLLLAVCFVLGADYYKSAAILRTSKELIVPERRRSVNWQDVPKSLIDKKTRKRIGPQDAVLGGGDTCGAGATRILALPFNDTGTTVGATDDYDLPPDVTTPTVTGCPTCNATGTGPAGSLPRGAVYTGTGTGPDGAYSITFVGPNNSLDVTMTPTGGQDLALLVYTDVCSSSLADAIVVSDTGVANTAEHVTISNMPAGTYHIVVDGYSAGGTPPGPSGPFTLAVTGTGTIGGGDTCTVPSVIPALPFNSTATTVGATDNYDLPPDVTTPTVTGCPTCNATGGGPAGAAPRGGVYTGTGTGPDVAYSITFGSSNNSLDVTMTPTGGQDLALIVYTNVCSNSLADAIVVDDDGAGGAAEHVTISNMPPGTYYIVVDGYSAGGTPPGPSGPFTLEVTGTGTIGGGDTCTVPNVIPVLPFNSTATTAGTTDNYDLPPDVTTPTVTGCPTCNATGTGPAGSLPRGAVYTGTGTGPDVAYSITFSSANNSLDVTMTPTGGQDLSLMVYTNVCSSDLADAIVVSDTGIANTAEHVTISNMPAGTYHIVVDGYSAGGTPPGPSGPYTLAVTGTGTIVPSAAISGTVTYGNAIGSPIPPRFVKNVSLSSTAGSPSVGPVITGTPGTYTLTGFGAGSYTIKPTKPAGPNAAISSFDAARVAQGVVGSPSFVSQNQRFAADVTGNGLVSSQDAGKIAQFAAGLPIQPPNLTSEWRFFVTGAPSPLPTPPQTYDDSRTYASVTSSLTGEDYVAILMGDVTGNWNPATHPRGTVVGGQMSDVSEDGGPVRGVAVELPQAAVDAGKEIIIPVSVEGVTGKDIISYEFNLIYDPAVIQPMQNPVDVTGTVSRGLSVVTNATEPGLLRVVVYGPMTIDENGILLNLRFTAVGAAGSVSPLTFERIMFNEGDPIVTVSDGKVELF